MREKNEDELTEYDLMVATAGQNPDMLSLVQFWADDTKYCWHGIAACAEWIALRQISLGKFSLDQENNFSVVSQYEMDYQIPKEQKVGVDILLQQYLQFSYHHLSKNIYYSFLL